MFIRISFFLSPYIIFIFDICRYIYIYVMYMMHFTIWFFNASWDEFVFTTLRTPMSRERVKACWVESFRPERSSWPHHLFKVPLKGDMLVPRRVSIAIVSHIIRTDPALHMFFCESFFRNFHHIDIDPGWWTWIFFSRLNMFFLDNHVYIYIYISYLIISKTIRNYHWIPFLNMYIYM